MEGTASDKEFIEFLDVLLGRSIALSVLMPIVHETSINDGGTYFISSSFSILSHLSICGRPQAARLFSRLVNSD